MRKPPVPFSSSGNETELKTYVVFKPLEDIYSGA